MEEQLQNSENNMQEQQNVKIPKKRGPKPKNQIINPSASVQSTTQLEVIHSEESDNNSPDIKALMSIIDELKQQNEKLMQIAKTISITTTKPLITCSDEDINSLYVNYITNKETALNNVLVAEVDGKVIITKSYYEIG